MAKTKLSAFVNPNNCAVNEQTGDGRTCGRCWFFLVDGKTCPRHGDVSTVMERYRETGKLTLEREHRASTKKG